MKESNEKLNKMMEELDNLIKTTSPLLMEALGEVDSHETEVMTIVASAIRLFKQFNGYVKACIDESEENNRRMKRLEEKLDTIIDRSGDINSVVHETRTIVRDVRGDIVILKKRKTED